MSIFDERSEEKTRNGEEGFELDKSHAATNGSEYVLASFIIRPDPSCDERR